MMNKSKGGVSNIIATVLIVLITVASVTIFWAGISPLLSKAAFVEDMNVRFKIDKSESYTVYDPETGYLRIQLKRGSDDAGSAALLGLAGW